MERPDDEPPSGLDVHAAAALDRLTRWAAKALRATVAVIRLADGESSVVASVTDVEAARASARMRELSAQILRTAQPRAIGDARTEQWQTSSVDDAVTLLGAPLLDRYGNAVGSFCVMHTSPRRWTIQDVELVSELTSSAMTELQLRAARADAEREKRWSDHQQAVLELIAVPSCAPATCSPGLDGGTSLDHRHGMTLSAASPGSPAGRRRTTCCAAPTRRSTARRARGATTSSATTTTCRTGRACG